MFGLLGHTTTTTGVVIVVVLFAARMLLRTGLGRRPSGPRGAGPRSQAGEPSRTAQGVAAVRAELTRPHSAGGDPDAARRLAAGLPAGRAEQLRPLLAVRTAFFDEQTRAAIARGVPQVVILGAGYDDRALRFRSPGVQFIEVDQPGTQADKRQRLQALLTPADRLMLVPADFTSERIDSVLALAGHDAGRDSLFLCEGVLVYLPSEAVATLLTGLAHRATPASLLAVSLSTGGPSAGQGPWRRPPGEAWRTTLPADQYLDVLRHCGWRPIDTIDPATRDPALQSGQSLLVTAEPAPGGRA